MKTGIIYLATNLVNNKKYIGQTFNALEYRKGKHLQNAFCSMYEHKFYQALRKYGKENFDWSIIETGVSEEIIDDREIAWISYYDSFNNGYNMTLGGHTIRGYRHTEETKNKIKMKMQGKSNLDHYIDRYGEEIGTMKYNEYIESMKDRKGKKRLDVLIDKYGEELGREKYENMVKNIKEGRKKKGSTNTLSKFIERYGEEIGRFKYKEFSDKMKSLKWSEEAKKDKSIKMKEYWKNKKRGT